MTDLTPTREQRELGQAVRDLLARATDSDAAWRTMCDQIGVAALAIPEEHGGAGFTLAETYLALEEVGYALVPSPLFSSVVVAAALQAVGATEQLEQVASGAISVLADGRNTVDWDGATLTGSVARVRWSADPEILITAARTGEDTVGLFAVTPAADGLTTTQLTPLDPTTEFASLHFAGVDATALSLDAADALAAADRAAQIATLAQQVGCSQRGLDMTVEYAKQRHQFGRPIGSFQALKHRMADMLVLTQMARSGAWAAVQAHVHHSPDAERLVASASRYCTDAAKRVAAETIQLHGGIAMTAEHDAHLVLKRAHVLAASL